MKTHEPGRDEPLMATQLRDATREQLRFSVCGQDLIQPRLSEQGLTNISFGGGALKGRPLLSGWVTISITTSQLALVEQGRTDEVDDMHLALHDRGLEAVAHVHLTGHDTSLTGWENLPFEEEMSPTEKLRWLHAGMVADLAEWIEGNADAHEPTPRQE